jgi:hypothetical protein
MATIKRKTKKNTKKGKTFRRNQKGGKPAMKITVPSNYKKREQFKKKSMVMFPGTLVRRTFSLEPNTAGNKKSITYYNLSTKGSTTKPSFKTATAAEHVVRLASQTNPQARLLQQSELLKTIGKNRNHVSELVNKYGSVQVSATANNAVKNFLEQSVSLSNLTKKNSIVKLREALKNPEHENKIVGALKKSSNIRSAFSVPSSPYEERLRNILEEHQQTKLDPKFLNYLQKRQSSASVETNA